MFLLANSNKRFLKEAGIVVVVVDVVNGLVLGRVVDVGTLVNSIEIKKYADVTARINTVNATKTLSLILIVTIIN